MSICYLLTVKLVLVTVVSNCLVAPYTNYQITTYNRRTLLITLELLIKIVKSPVTFCPIDIYNRLTGSYYLSNDCLYFWNSFLLLVTLELLLLIACY